MEDKYCWYCGEQFSSKNGDTCQDCIENNNER